MEGKEPFLTGQSETSKDELEELLLLVRDAYKESGMDSEMVDLFMKHNRQVLDFVRKIADGEKFNEREREIAELAAVLHDKRKGAVDFEEHGSEGGVSARKLLLSLGKSEGLAESVRLAIERHMGNTGFVGEQARKKYGQEFRYPEPETRVGRSVYEADMLTILTREGVEKLLHIREIESNLRTEDERVASEKKISLEEARFASIRKSVENSLDILTLETSKRIADELLDVLYQSYPLLRPKE